MGSLLSLGGGRVIVEFPDEPVTGADMQWDFVNQDNGTFFRVLVQAKQLYGDGAHWTRHTYRELLHTSGSSGRLQAQVLCDTARSQNATYPLYAFYHPGRSCALARNQGITHIEGVNLANGYAMETLTLAAMTPSLRTQVKRLGTLYPYFFSLRDLFCPDLVDPLGPMAFHPREGYAIPLILSFDAGRPVLGFPLPPRPEDVHQRLADHHGRLEEFYRLLAPELPFPEMPPVSHTIPDDVQATIERRRSAGPIGERGGSPLWRVTFVSGNPRM